MKAYRYKEAIFFRQMAPLALLGLVVITAATFFGGISWGEWRYLLVGLFTGLSIGYWRCTTMYVESQQKHGWIEDPELGFAGNERSIEKGG